MDILFPQPKNSEVGVGRVLEDEIVLCVTLREYIMSTNYGHFTVCNGPDTDNG